MWCFDIKLLPNILWQVTLSCNTWVMALKLMLLANTFSANEQLLFISEIVFWFGYLCVLSTEICRHLLYNIYMYIYYDYILISKIITVT